MSLRILRRDPFLHSLRNRETCSTVLALVFESFAIA